METIVAEEAPVVFVGFGASAPERQWDDYGDIDLAGKVAVFLVNDPDFAAGPDEPAAGRFGNRASAVFTPGLLPPPCRPMLPFVGSKARIIPDRHNRARRPRHPADGSLSTGNRLNGAH